MRVTNITHFLNEDGSLADLPREAADLLDFLGQVVAAASFSYDLPVATAGEICCADVKGRRCNGFIEVWVDTGGHYIGWECLECGDEGMISGWEGTVWDLRHATLH
jgi:hypothetical protein